MDKKVSIGGQAVIEGVLMRGPHYYSIAVRKQDGSISVKRDQIHSSKSKLSKVPFFRGVFTLWDTLEIGFKAIMYSANESSGEDEKLGKGEMFFTVLVSIAFALLIFVAAPYYLSTWFAKGGSLLFNIVDGILRAAIFVVYLLLISLLKDVKVMFQYHGAEHMSIHAHEAGKPLTVKEVEKFRTMHPRCGTSFLLFVMLKIGRAHV